MCGAEQQAPTLGARLCVVSRSGGGASEVEHTHASGGSMVACAQRPAARAVRASARARALRARSLTRRFSSGVEFCVGVDFTAREPADDSRHELQNIGVSSSSEPWAPLVGRRIERPPTPDAWVSPLHHRRPLELKPSLDVGELSPNSFEIIPGKRPTSSELGQTLVDDIAPDLPPGVQIWSNPCQLWLHPAQLRGCRKSGRARAKFGCNCPKYD